MFQGVRSEAPAARARLLQGGLVLCLLAATAWLAGGCSDSGGSSGADTGQADADATADSQPDTPADTTSDTEEEMTPDLVEDGVDVVPDTEDDGVADLVEDTADDLPSDANIGDQPSDLGTTEYEVCPYETESATVDCTSLCAAVVLCDGAEAEAFCLEFCTTAKSLFNQGAATAFATCITGTSCDSVPEGEDLGGYCFLESRSGLPENTAGSAACASVDAAIETCLGEASSFGAECDLIAPVLRSETAPVLEDCADEPCDAIENCVSAAVCDILL